MLHFTSSRDSVRNNELQWTGMLQRESNLSVRVAEFLAGVFRGGAQLFLDTQDLVVLAQSLWTAWRACFDLASRETDHQISNERVLRFSGTMGDHGAPAVALGEFVGVDGLGHAADLIDLQQQAVAGLLLDGCLDPESAVGYIWFVLKGFILFIR